MIRDIKKLAAQTFDVLVIGAGIYGICVARDAALRGLSVAIIDKADFVSGNSANSLKIIHGGLRYLQSADLKRMVESINERRLLLKLAPHLIKPLTCLMPTYGMMMKSRHVMAAAMLVNDIIGFKRNAELLDDQHIKSCRTISRQECLTSLPGLDPAGVTGAAVWYDAQAYNTERLPLGYLHTAVDSGAVAANYVEAQKLLVEKGRTIGARVVDNLHDEEFDIRARMVVTCSARTTDHLLNESGIKTGKRIFQPSTAMNIVLKKEIIHNHAAGLRQVFEYGGKKHSRVLFFTPWRGVTVIGTRHLPPGTGTDATKVTENKVAAFLSEINSAYPGIKLKLDDVAFVHWGIIPMDGINSKSGEVILTPHYKIQHHKDAGAKNLLTLVGVKYTTARLVAEKAMNLISTLLGHENLPSKSAHVHLPGGDIKDFESLKGEIANYPGDFSDQAINHLASNYGSKFRDVLEPAEENHELVNLIPGSVSAPQAEVLYSVRKEMAIHLDDVILRRTDIGTKCKPADETISAVAKLMAKELNWTLDRIDREIEKLDRIYSF